MYHFGVGQPEFVVTLPEYRKRGLIRTLFEILHARSEAEGHLVQAEKLLLEFYLQGFSYYWPFEIHPKQQARYFGALDC